MALYVDGREEAKKGWCAKLRHEGIDAKTAPNLPADFVWSCPSGLVIVERKTWPDFVASMHGASGSDGGSRLVGQLIGTVKAAGVKVLFLEGALPAYVQGGGHTVSASGMDDAAVSLQWQFGCILVHSLSEEHTPTRLAAFYRYTQKEDHMSLLRPQPPVPEEDIYFNPDFRRKIAAMMCTPRVGEKTALILPNETKTPQEAINLSRERLIEIMGKAKGAAFDEFWKAPW